MDILVFAVLAVAGGVGILLAFMMYQKHFQSRKSGGTNIPGAPRTHPTDGNTQEITNAGGVGPFLAALHKKYGPIVSFYEGPKMSVSLASPELLKTMRTMSDVAEEMNEPFRALVGDENLGFIPTEQALERRKHIDPFFALRACKTFYTCLHEIAQEYLKKWSKSSPDDYIMVKEEMMDATFKGILRTSFGTYFKDEKKFQLFRKKDEESMLLIQKFPDRSEEDNLKLQQIGKEQKEVVRQILEDRKKEKNKDEDHPLLIDLFLSEDISDEMRISDCFLFLATGYFTTAMLLTHIIYLISLNPDVQEKVYQEIIEILGDDKHVDNDTMPKLTYIRQVIDETLRFIPLADVFGRKAVQDMEINGYEIPKGTSIYQNYSVLAKSPNFFQNPDKFDPDHFTKESTRNRNPYAFKPFGFAGKRQCPGQSFVYIEVPVLLTEWCRLYKFSLAPGQPIKFSHGVMHYLEEAWVTLTQRKN